MLATPRLLLAALLLAPAGVSRAAGEDGMDGMVWIPTGSAAGAGFWMDRTEVKVASFNASVRAAGAYFDLEGPTYRYSVEACLDCLRFFRTARARAGAAGEFRAGRTAAVRAAFAAAFPARSDLDPAADPDALARDPDVRRRIAAQAELPVRGVSWNDADAYARRVGKRLPTEAEWLRAAAGPSGQPYPWGDAFELARCRILADGPEGVATRPEGASAEGCLAMAGNVWEWCAGWYTEGAVPSRGDEAETRKVVRGGGFAAANARQAARLARTDSRAGSNPAYGHPDVGFRCAR